MTVRSKNSNAITERQLASRPHSRDLAPVDKLRRADDWEDWEDESFEPKLAPAAAGPTTIAAQRPAAAAAAAPEEDKFAGEDEGEDEPVYKAHVPEPQQSKKQPKRYQERDKADAAAASAAAEQDQPLDDPVLEKLRQQRLVEEADFRAAQELFSSDDKALDTLIPKSAKDFEDFGRLVANKYLIAHSRNPHYKALLKTLFKAALAPLPVQETKDIETTVAGLRADKVKAEAAEKAAKAKAGKKKNVNVGNRGGTAGLDDYKFDQPLDDDYDFM